MENYSIAVNIIGIICCIIFVYGIVSAVKDGYNFFKKKPKKKGADIHESLKVPEYQPMAYDYAQRHREHDLLHVSTMIYANKIVAPEESFANEDIVQEADELIKAVGSFLKKERAEDILSGLQI